MKRIILFLLCLILCFGTVACANEEESKSQNFFGKPLIEYEGEKPSTYAYVNPYETQLQLSTMQIWGYLGKAELNTNADYVKSGKGSLKLNVIADPVMLEDPCVYQGMDQTSLNGEFLSDFTDVTHITFDVYSTLETNTQIGVGLVYEWNVNKTKQSEKEWIEVKPGWNKIVYTTKRDAIPLASIVVDEQTKEVPFVEYISIWFERGESDREFYIDDLKLYKTGTPATEIEDVRAENEIATFDQSWQISSLEHFSWVAANLQPRLELNTDINYASGNRGGSLKMTFPDTGNEEKYLGVNMKGAFLDKMDFTQYSDNAYLCVDFYTPTENPVSMVAVKLLGPDIDNDTFYLLDNYAIKAGKWTTVRIPFKEMRALPNPFAGDNTNPSNQNPLMNIDSCKIIQIATNSKSYESVLYVDNIRVEDIG